MRKIEQNKGKVDLAWLLMGISMVCIAMAMAGPVFSVLFGDRGIKEGKTTTAGDSATIEFTIEEPTDLYSSETVGRFKKPSDVVCSYGGKIAETVYKMATENTELKRIVVRVTGDFPERTLTNAYGKEQVVPAKTKYLGEIVVADAAEVRKHTKDAYLDPGPTAQGCFREEIIGLLKR